MSAKSQRIKWSGIAIDAYKKAGEELKAKGFKPLREVNDPDTYTVLTFWADGKSGVTIIQQTWTDTGDVVLYRQFDGAL